MTMSPDSFEKLSVIVPVHNERENIEPLCGRLFAVLESIGQPWEVIFVNDGSTDGSGGLIDVAASRDPRVRAIHFTRNFGQTSALMAGIDAASGEVILPMDADLQNDPDDIPSFLDKIREGYDVVSGWRRDRQDDFLSRILPSRAANFLISRISGLQLHDYGCTMKAYRRRLIKEVRLYGEMHRFIPIYVHWIGGRVAEIPVRHRPRLRGQSKYGLSRIFKVILDLIVIKFMLHYDSKPIYVFGFFGLASMAISMLAAMYALYLKFVEGLSFIETPLPLLVVFTFMTGSMFILIGLLAEIIMRTYYEARRKTAYCIDRVSGGREEDGAGDEDPVLRSRRS